MRKSKNDIIDLSKPINLSQLSNVADDCFGKEWNNIDPACVKCSAYETCMVLCKSTKFAKAKKKTYFDQLNWDAVPWSDILSNIKQNPGQTTMNEIREVVKHYSKCIDDVTVNMKVQNWLIENNCKIQDSCVY